MRAQNKACIIVLILTALFVIFVGLITYKPVDTIRIATEGGNAIEVYNTDIIEYLDLKEIE